MRRNPLRGSTPCMVRLGDADQFRRVALFVSANCLTDQFGRALTGLPVILSATDELTIWPGRENEPSFWWSIRRVDGSVFRRRPRVPSRRAHLRDPYPIQRTHPAAPAMCGIRA